MSCVEWERIFCFNRLKLLQEVRPGHLLLACRLLCINCCNIIYFKHPPASFNPELLCPGPNKKQLIQTPNINFSEYKRNFKVKRLSCYNITSIKASLGAPLSDTILISFNSLQASVGKTICLFKLIINTIP